ncbi:hypothetical protein FGIG_02447, partial [Fasciola gigantica]
TYALLVPTVRNTNSWTTSALRTPTAVIAEQSSILYLHSGLHQNKNASCEKKWRQMKLNEVSTVENYDYTLAEKSSFTPTKKGWQLIELSSDWLMEPGDRIGIQFVGSSPIGCANKNSSQTGDLVSDIQNFIQGATLSSTSLKRSTKIAQINAWSTIARELTFSGRMNRAGSSSITLTLNTFFLEESPMTFTRDITVLQAFNDTKLVRRTFEIGKDATLTLNPHSGVATQYSWSFGDATSNRITNEKTVNHSYSSEGTFPLTVNISNDFSFLVINDTVSIRQPMQFTAIEANDAEVGKSTVIKLIISPSPSPNSGIQCVWKFNGTEDCKGQIPSCQHTYAQPGVYQIEVVCTNLITTQNQSAQKIAYSLLKGLQILTQSFAVGKERRLIFSFTDGSELSAKMHINGSEKKTVIDYQSKRILSEPFDVNNAQEFQYTLEVTDRSGPNPFKGAFAFDIPVQKITMKFSVSKLIVNQDLSLSVGIADATGVKVIVDWGDGSVNSNYSAKPAQPWQRTKPFTKAYTQPGIYTIAVTAESGESSLTERQIITVQGAVPDYTVESDSSSAPLNQKYGIRLVATGTGVPGFARITIDWGDQTTPDEMTFYGNETYFHVYTTERQNLIKIVVANEVGNKSYTRPVKVQKSIENFGCPWTGAPVKVGTQVNFEVLMKSAENVQLNVICESNAQPITLVLPVANDKKVPCQYNSPGVRNTNITVIHPTGNKQCILPVDVRLPVTGMTANIEEPKECSSLRSFVEIAFNGMDKEFPTLAEYTIDWGDGSDPDKGQLQLSKKLLSITHTWPRFQNYLIVITVDNGVGPWKTNKTIGIFSRILSVDLSVTVNATGQSGYGFERNNYALYVPMRLTVLADGRTDNVANTEFVITYLDSQRSVTLPRAPSNYQVYTFTEPGPVQIKATGSNAISNVSRTKTIYLRATLRGLRLSVPYSLVKPNQESLLKISFEAVSSDTCICVTKSDTKGSVVIPAGGKQPQDCQPCPLYKPTILTPVNNSLLIPILYDKVTSDLITVEAINTESSVSGSLFVTISEETCIPPRIILVPSELGDSSRPIPVQDHRPTTIETRLSASQCVSGSQYSIRWTLNKVNEDTLDSEQKINVSGLSSAQTMTLIIPVDLLEPGTYAATITMAVQQPSVLNPTVLTRTVYLMRSYPSLVVQFDEGNPISMKVGLDQPEICLYPEVHSYDPGIASRLLPQNINNWTWHCAQSHEKLTDDLVYPKPPGFSHPIPKAGCFGEGPGQLNLTAGSLCFSTDNLEPNKKYRMQVRGTSDDGRSTMAVMDLVTQAGRVPTVRLRCTIPTLCRTPPKGISESIAWGVAQSDDLYLTAGGSEIPPGASVSYTWGLRKTYPTTLGPVLSKSVLSYYTEGYDKFTLKIKKDFLTSDESATGCVVCANVGYAGSVGTSCLRFVYLKPPTEGTCTHRMASNTTACITCTDFISSFGQPVYQFYLNTNPRTIVAVDDNPTVCIKLPITKVAVKLCVAVSDTFGNTITNCFAEVTVPSPPKEDVVKSLAELMSTGNATLQNVVLTGNLTTKASVVAAVADTLSEWNSLLAQEQAGLPVNKTTVNEQRNQRAEIISQAVAVASTMVPTDAPSVLLSTTAVKSLIQNGGDMDRSSQVLLTGMLSRVTDGLAQLVATENSEEQRAVADEVLYNVVSLIKVMNSQINDAVPKDIVRDKAKLDYDVDLDSTGLRSSGDEVWEELSLENAASKQSSTVAASSLTFGSILETRMNLVGPMLVDGNDPVITETPTTVVGMVKMSGTNLTDYSMPQSAQGTRIIVPDLCGTLNSSNISCNGSFTIQSTTTATNVFSFLKSAQSGIKVTSYSETVSLSIYSNGTALKFYTAEFPFEIFIGKKPDFIPPEFTSIDPQNNRSQLPPSRIAADNNEVYQALLVTQFVLPDDNSGLTFQLLPEDVEACPQYLVFARPGCQPPIISQSGGNYDFWQALPKNTADCSNGNTNDTDKEDYLYTFFLDNSQLLAARTKALSKTMATTLSPEAKARVYIGYRQLNPAEVDKYGPSNPPPVPYPHRDQINNTALSRAFVSSCVSTKTENPTAWTTSGCLVGKRTTTVRTQCFCWHLSTFAAGWLELPNAIDFDYVFANMDFTKNPTLYATEIAIFGIFILLFIWARRADLKDMEKLGVTPLAENNPKHEYLYEFIVSTGQRTGSGTDSKVCCILSGDYGETGPFVLRDPRRKVLQRGNVDRFLLACPQPLGNLIYCRLWHDNSGQGDRASWYCNYVGVVDLQTREKSHFIVGKWFAVEEEDGQVDRLIPVSSREEMLTFAHMFSTSVSRNMSEDHLWISVVARRAMSRFTRLERVACCLLLLFLSMLTSCMFYKAEGAIKQPNLFTIGPFAFTAQEVFVAVINNLITFVPVFLVTYLFRASRLHTSHATKLREVVEDHLNETIDATKLPPITEIATIQQRTLQTTLFYQNRYQAEEERKQTRRSERSCPWQMRILAWTILILCLAAAATFTTFYGVSFGEAACKKWLTSLFLSFFTSVLLVQPIKVMLLSLFISFACKQTDRVDDIEILVEEDALIEGLGRRYQLQLDEEYLHDEYLMRNFKPKRLKVLPPDPMELERARALRVKQRQANDIMREIFFYVIFLILLLLVTTGFRDPNAFRLKKSLQTEFFPNEYDQMHTVDDFNNWVRQTLIPGLRAKRWYNRDPPLYQRGFLKDRSDRIIGYGLMRQVRTKPNSCNVYDKMKPMVKNCYSTYDLLQQDKQSYGNGWIPFNGNSKQNNSSPEFTYTSQSDLHGIPYMGDVTWYSGGGYVFLLRGTEDEMQRNFDKLDQEHWIDFSTRAIIVQLSIFNPNINLFAIITALIEKPGTGALIPSYRIETANLFGSAATEAGRLDMAFQIVFILALIGYMIKEIRNIYHEKCNYFKMFWSYVEWFILIGSFAAIAAYVYMIVATKEAIAEFSRTHGNVFMNFQFLAYWNESLTYLTALICFVSTLKLVRLFRFNQRIGLLGSVLRYAAKDMKYFMIVFFVMFFAFVLVFYLLYADTLEGFRSFLGSTETCMQIILGKFDFTSMYEREMVLGPLLFALFTLCVIFVMVSMFVAILDDSFRRVLEDLELQSKDHEMTQFILAQFVLWTGLSRTSWGKRLVESTQATQEPTFLADSEWELNNKLNELTRMMDEFLSYVQINQLAETEK